MVASVTAKGLREKRADLIAQAQAIVKEKGEEITAEDTAKINALMDDAADLESQATTMSRLESVQASLEARLEPAASGRSVEPERQTIKVRDGRAGQYREIQAGRRGSAEYRKNFASFLGGNMSVAQFATLQESSDERGGYLVTPEQLAAGLIKDLDDMLWIRQWATVHTVTEAASLGIRCRTSKASSAAYGTELQVATADAALKYGKRTLTPHDLTAQIRVSRNLLRYTTAGAEAEVISELVLDVAECQEDGFLLGNGDKKPLGLFVASDNGIPTSRDVSTDNTTTEITAKGLVNAFYSLKERHRQNARWLFHRDGIKKVALIQDDNGNFLWKQGLELGKPDLLLGRPVHESERVPATFTTGLYVGMVADFSYYHIADALDQEMQRLDELFSQTGEIGFISRSKNDGMPVLAEAFARVKLA